MEKVLDKIHNEPLDISRWIASFLGILFIRFIFEFLSSPSGSGVIASDPYTLIHYILFFLCIVLSTGLVVGYTTKNFVKTAKVILFGLPVIWIAPIIDIVLSHGRGYKMTYIFDTHRRLLFDFLTFFGPGATHGATYGIRVEVALILIGIGWYVWHEKKDVWKTALAVFVSYVFGFVFASFPGILYTITHPGSGTTAEVLGYLENLIKNSNIFYNTLHDGASSVSASRFFELGFDKLMSQMLFIISCFFGSIFLWKINSSKFLAVVKNMRSERINFYIACLLSGIGFAYINRLTNPLTWVDMLGIFCLIISWVGLWMHAVHLNDVADIEIDKISNTERPLIRKDVSSEEMYQIGNLWLAVALIGSWSAGFYPFFMSLVYIAASYIYSSPPLRLRRFPLIPSFLIGVACLATILAGFFFISVHKEIQYFPILLASGIVIMVTLAINFKDIKDIEGDRAEGIITIATVFGDKAPKIIGLLLAVSILLAPIFLSFYLLYIFAIPAAIAGYIIITKKPYQEKQVFILRFIFLACIGLSYIVGYWLIYINHSL